MLGEARLKDADWMRRPLALALQSVFKNAGVEARFVGGCVRDHLLGRPIGDVDMAVPMPPDRVLTVLGNAGIRAIPTGIDHGTLTIVGDGETIEITSLRKDVETDGRRAVIAFTSDWATDSWRRDFTMNAIYADGRGQVLDFHGGLKDLADRRIRFIGDADLRIREDVLRILRFFRFHAQLNLPVIDAEGLAACAARKDLLPNLSAERVAQEVLKLLSAPAPDRVIRVMIEGGFLADWIPEAAYPDDLARLTKTEPGADPIRRLAALCGTEGSAVGARLKLSRGDQLRLTLLGDRPDPPKTEPAARQLLYRNGLALGTDLALVGIGRGEDWQTTLHVAKTWTIPVFPIGGEDAIAVGLKPGPNLGRALARVEQVWIDSDFSLDRASLMKKLIAT